VLSLGAGGGGFLLVLSDEPERTREAMREAGAPELRFGVDEKGCVSLDGSAQ
jgi:galactokinase/mevalonate kinase-like predicted kinase